MPDAAIVVLGAGPAGLAAAGRAAECGQRVVLIDDNGRPGGQIWRADVSEPPHPEMLPWQYRVTERHVEVWTGSQVAASPGPSRLLVETPQGPRNLRYSKLILATGARERFLPFAGWTLPGVMGAGGLQALVKSGWPINGRRVVVAGSGPLLLAVASYLRRRGARVLAVAEQASAGHVRRFAAGLALDRHRLGQALRLRASLLGTPYRTSCWPVSAEGDGKLERVTLTGGRTLDCDYLACGFGLIPNTEPAALLGCRIEDGRVAVDEWQQTSVSGVYAAGEVTGVGGVDLALAEGEIAGFSAGGNPDAARKRFAVRDSNRRFAVRMNAAFALRAELRQIPRPDTVLCRCEDVSFERAGRCSGWREAKLHTRCGMGPCQGRVCGEAARFLFGWDTKSGRQPILPVDISLLSHSSDG
jgi:NADPH-dependent 2,4-dienoyl-CoA reductase/sulfur reductase-like enzyme